MQLMIAQRAARMLKEGGRMVYSTCSMNPMEDEAVVAEIIRFCFYSCWFLFRLMVFKCRWSDGAMRLLDCSHLLPKFRRNPGLSDWKLMNKEGEFVKPTDENSGAFTASMWPPSAEEREKFHLERCWRIYPHHQDTGGFFCAVLEKVSALPGAPKRAKIEVNADEGKGKEEMDDDGKGKEEMDDKMDVDDGKKAEEKPQQPEKKKKRVRRNYESPYIMVDPNSEAGETVRQGIEYFGLDLDPKRFMVRNDKSVG